MVPTVNDPSGQPVATVIAESDGTVVIVFAAGARLEADNTIGVIRAHIAAAAGQKRFTIADVRGLRSVSRDARELAAAADVAAITSRMALIVGNPVSRVLGNFFMTVTNPKYPTRIFSDEVAARNWLRGPE